MSSFLFVIVILIHLNSLESTIFKCDSTSLCSSVNNCASNESCLIICDGNHVCENKTFHCPSNGKCIIHCGTNITQQYSCYRALFTSKSDTEIINITTQGMNSMEYSTTFCPSNNCFIYSLDGQSQLSNINIYAVESYNDIYIQCNNKNCYESSSFPTIYCSDYLSSCEIELQNVQSTQFNMWQCTPNTAMSICNSISFISTTDIVISVEQTISSWTNMVNNIEPVKKNKNRNVEAAIIGAILGAITCCLFVCIFMMASYLGTIKSTSLKSIIVIDTKQKELQRLGSKSDTTTTDNDSRFLNKRRAAGLPKPKPRYIHHKMKLHEKEKQTYVITPTPEIIKNDISDDDPDILIDSYDI